GMRRLEQFLDVVEYVFRVVPETNMINPAAAAGLELQWLQIGAALKNDRAGYHNQDAESVFRFIQVFNYGATEESTATFALLQYLGRDSAAIGPLESIYETLPIDLTEVLLLQGNDVADHVEPGHGNRAMCQLHLR